jgi:hypothetical protein
MNTQNDNALAPLAGGKSWKEIEERYGMDVRSLDPIAQYTGEEFAPVSALDDDDVEMETTEVLLYIVGSDSDGWIIVTRDVYADGEMTADGGANHAGTVIYPTRRRAAEAAVSFADGFSVTRVSALAVVTAIENGLKRGASDDDWDAPEMQLARDLTEQAGSVWDFDGWRRAADCLGRPKARLGGVVYTQAGVPKSTGPQAAQDPKV